MPSVLALAAFLGLAACATTPLPPPPPSAPLTPELEQIAQTLLRDIEVLASDDFGGRKPGSEGEEKTLLFIQAELEKAGLVSGTHTAEKPWRLRVPLSGSKGKEAPFTYNLIGKLPGTDPDQGAVLLMGHWDHLGECGKRDDIDRICNGAVDNASGIAAILELARRLAQSGPHGRDIYVLATGAEEMGLIGAQAFVRNPPFALERIVAAFNFDSVALAPVDTPLAFKGEGLTELDPVIRQAVARAGRVLADPRYPRKFLKRQDGWAFLKAGVPAVNLSSTAGNKDIFKHYLRTRYHAPSDEVEGMELGGAAQDLLLHYDLITLLADPARYQRPAQSAQ